jgi:thiol-disulfide isomerase/thioredoxin
MADGKSNLPAGRLIGIAAVAGVLAGALGVYVMGGPSGNNSPMVAGAAPDPQAVAACEAKTDKVAALDPLITGEVAAMLPADPPRLVSDIAFNDPDGQPMRLSDLGKVTLVNLWATWCAPCREEMPALNQLQAEPRMKTWRCRRVTSLPIASAASRLSRIARIMRPQGEFSARSARNMMMIRTMANRIA